jgi:hypothetical protein
VAWGATPHHQSAGLHWVPSTQQGTCRFPGGPMAHTTGPFCALCIGTLTIRSPFPASRPMGNVSAAADTTAVDTITRAAVCPAGIDNIVVRIRQEVLFLGQLTIWGQSVDNLRQEARELR